MKKYLERVSVVIAGISMGTIVPYLIGSINNWYLPRLIWNYTAKEDLFMPWGAGVIVILSIYFIVSVFLFIKDGR